METTTKQGPVSGAPLDLSHEAKAAVLIEALPWLQAYRDRIVVIKFGGNAMVDDELMHAFAEDIAFLHSAGVRPVVVHGGGPQISRMLDQLGIASEFRDGFRVTSTEAMRVVRMVLTGDVSRTLVTAINAHTPNAVAISGEDARMLRGTRRVTTASGAPVDLGHVGDVSAVDPAQIHRVLERGGIPVISGIAVDIEHPEHSLNINADLAAGAIAAALGAEKLVVLTDVAGLYADWPDESSLIRETTTSRLRELMPSLSTGMIPKIEACVAALEGGVPRAAIVDGRRRHSILIEIFTPGGSGTEITNDDDPAASSSPEHQEPA